MARWFGVSLPLAPYEEMPGLRFALYLVSCLSCGQRRLMSWPRYVDVAVAGRWLGDNELLGLSATGCARCHRRGVLLEAVWIAEPPRRRDPLLELCCVWHVTDELSLVQPPPGTVRELATDIVLEARLSELLEETEPPAPSPRIRQMQIVYSMAELRAAHGRSRGGDRGTRLIFIEHLATRLRQGLRSAAETEDAAQQLPPSILADADWKVELHMKGQDPARQFAGAVVDEAIGATRQIGPQQRAILAGQTATAYCGLDQIALAMQAMARARDLADQVSDEGERAQLHRLLAITDGEIASRAGRVGAAQAHLDLAAELRPDASGPAPDEPSDWRAPALVAREFRAMLAYRRGELEDAVREYGECVVQYEGLLAEPASTEVEARHLLRHSASGAWSNYAKALTLSADALEDDRASLALVELLERLFGCPVTPRAVRERALGFVLRALEISRPLDSWDFVITQLYNAGLTLDDLDRSAEALAYVTEAAAHLSRVPGHKSTTGIHRFLAHAALDRGDGPRAIVHWTQVVRNEIRRVLEHAGDRHEATENAIVDAVLRTTELGGDPASAILLVESLRGLATAASVARGVPGAGAAPVQRADAALIERRARLVTEREALRAQPIVVPGQAALPAGDRRWSSLLLAPDAVGDSGELSEDRILDELPVKSGAFVNLAACGTAALQHGTGFVEGGLVSAFLAAGARAVLATSWNIDDRLAARFHVELYRRMLAGASPLASLLDTQRGCLAGHLGEEMQDPAVWAGYHLFGTG